MFDYFIGIVFALFLIFVGFSAFITSLPPSKKRKQQENEILRKDLDEKTRALAQKDKELEEAIESERQIARLKMQEKDASIRTYAEKCDRLNAALRASEQSYHNLYSKKKALLWKNEEYRARIQLLEQDRKNLADENKLFASKASEHIEISPPPRPLSLRIDRTLYQNGVDCGKLKAALSENIIERFVDIGKAQEIETVFDEIEIIPNSDKSKADGNYRTCLARCSCEDFRFHADSQPHACKHMFTLAMQLGILTVAGEPLTPPRKTK